MVHLLVSWMSGIERVAKVFKVDKVLKVVMTLGALVVLGQVGVLKMRVGEKFFEWVILLCVRCL